MYGKKFNKSKHYHRNPGMDLEPAYPEYSWAPGDHFSARIATPDGRTRIARVKALEGGDDQYHAGESYRVKVPGIRSEYKGYETSIKGSDIWSIRRKAQWPSYKGPSDFWGQRKAAAPVAPAKPVTAYGAFFQAHHPGLMASGLSYGQAEKEVNRMWKESKTAKSNPYKSRNPFQYYR